MASPTMTGFCPPCAGLPGRGSSPCWERYWRETPGPGLPVAGICCRAPRRRPDRAPLMRPPRIEPEFIVDAIAALDRIDSGLAAKAAGAFLAWPKTYGLDALLIPAVLGFDGPAGSESSARARLRGACIAHLRARIAEPLAPPGDWARAGKVGCDCARCGELSLFLVDPTRATWNFKAAQPDRSHVESTIRNSRCDVDFKTLRQGSPHILACAKNQASFERRVRQRRKDLEKLARIEIAFTTVAP